MAEASSSPEPSTAAAAQRRPAVLLCARESEAPGLHLSTYDKHWGIQPGRRGHSSPPLPPLNALLRGMPDRFLEGHPGRSHLLETVQKPATVSRPASLSSHFICREPFRSLE